MNTLTRNLKPTSPHCVLCFVQKLCRGSVTGFVPAIGNGLFKTSSSFHRGAVLGIAGSGIWLIMHHD
jgi:hypothetical protein